jgi:periplasmic divalent cation tolerance protein
MIILYCPFPNEQSALHFARILLEKKLIACAQVFPPMKSLYNWEDEIKMENEILLLLKTKKDFFPYIEIELQAHHPYKCPCLIEIAVNQVNFAYLKWLEASVVSP